MRLRVRELRAAGAAARARRAAHRAPLRLPPRRPVARRARGRARGRLGRGAPARPRLRHGRPALAPARRAELLGLLARLAASVRRARQPRLRDLARPVLAAGRARPARARDDAARHGVEIVELRGKRIELAGVDPRSWLAEARAATSRDSDADLRILLCHFPRALDRVPEGRWDLILAGHLHAGQIVLPYGFGKLLLAHPRAPLPERASSQRGGTTMHVSPGLGTTFVPFRFFARPEATELVLRSWRDGRPQRHLARRCSRATRPTRPPRCRGVHTKQRRGARVLGQRGRGARRRRLRREHPGRRRRRAAARRRLPRSGWPTCAPSAVHVVVDDVMRP